MAIGESSDWQEAYGEQDQDGNLVNMPLVEDNLEWPGNLTAFMDMQLADAELDGVAVTSFTFNSLAMETAILGLPSTAGIIQGWTAYVTLSACVVPTGQTIPGPGGGLLASPGAGVVLATSITLGANKLAELVDAQPVADAKKSEFPKLLQEATAMLQYTVTGVDSASKPLTGVVDIK